MQSVYNHFVDKEGLVAARVTKHGPASAPFAGPGSLGSTEDVVRTFVERVLRIAFEQRDPHLVRIRFDEQLAGHGTPPGVTAKPPDPSSSLGGRLA